MKAIGSQLFRMQRTGTRRAPAVAWRRIDARTAGLGESWFREAASHFIGCVACPRRRGWRNLLWSGCLLLSYAAKAEKMPRVASHNLLQGGSSERRRVALTARPSS